MSPEQMRRQRLMELSRRSRGDEEIIHPNRRAMLSGISDQGEDLKTAADERERFAAEMEQQKIEKAEQEAELSEERLKGKKEVRDIEDTLDMGKKIGKHLAGMGASPYAAMAGSRMPQHKDEPVDVMAPYRKKILERYRMG
jgi:hypothetical protein